MYKAEYITLKNRESGFKHHHALQVQEKRVLKRVHTSGTDNSKVALNKSPIAVFHIGDIPLVKALWQAGWQAGCNQD